MVQGQPDALLAVFNRVAAVAQPAGFDHHRRERRRLAVAWSDERFFAPWQVIKVAPFALSRYATPYGHEVIISELLWVWLPGMVLMGMLWWKNVRADALTPALSHVEGENLTIPSPVGEG